MSGLQHRLVHPWSEALGPSRLPPLYPPPRQECGGVLTIDSQGHLSLPGPHPGHHGSAHILPSILLADGFEGQGLLVAQDLVESGGGYIRHKGGGLGVLLSEPGSPRQAW